MKKINLILVLTLVIPLGLFSCQSREEGTDAADPRKTLSLKDLRNGEKPRNVIFILSDDHRFDFMGFTGKIPWLETPNMDRMAAEGAHFPNAFVTTSLCSPSRASILTGLFSHSHTVVDNVAPVPEDLVFFPQYLQNAGYETAFFGKWHMGNDEDDPRPGFDHWESFRGQGVYYNPTLNINGERVSYGDSTYITDLLTEHALDWLKQRNSDKPYFLYLSHKAVHAEFAPAKRHFKEYENKELVIPPSFNTSAQDVTGKRRDGSQTLMREGPTPEPYSGEDYYGEGRMPDWQKMQREGWHGVDYMYHGKIDFADFYRRYCETLLGVDESIGAVLDYLDEIGEAESTLVIYMGDNGFSFGEHGLIDKRHFYEESVKVPFLARCPEIFPGGKTIEKMVQNIDIAPTVLEMAGLEKPDYMHGFSFIPLLKGEEVEWRDRIYYEYYWEYDFPHTPTMHGVRTDRYKYIRYHGIWDTNEFYDLLEDPYEMNNLIESQEHQELIQELAHDVYDWLEDTDGMQIPLKRTVKSRYGDHRNRGVH
ncbi:sulfatase [Negadavirga shengliensis]|uniref:Sulfatase n=1 Tax=Negadavirga shengliensis TaxID=1389218 RepID=A0ABV9SWS4_9BACT